MEFRKYQHLERFGTSDVQNIELGECFIFPKIDGTNASAWFDNGYIQGGSRKRHLTLEKDNAGFLLWLKEQSKIILYLKSNPTHRLYGEWLVPHSLKTYREDTWRRFYVFDVGIDKTENEILNERDNTVKYLSYNEYQPLMEEYGIDYIAPISIIKNASYEQLVGQLDKNVFLIEDGKGCGEGIVLKNYSFINKYGRQTWAKIVTSEFKEKHTKEMGAPEMQGAKLIEEEIVKKYVTGALCDKVYAKIENDGGFRSRDIPRLLNTIYHDLITEEAWNFTKEFKNPIINFKTLMFFTYAKIKIHFEKLF